MPLTTIDGVLCIPQDEFAHLTTFLGLREHAVVYAQMYRSLKDAEERLGAKGRSYYHENGMSSHSPLSYLPDEWLIREIYKAIQPTTDKAPCKVGEEDIDGMVWTIPGDATLVNQDFTGYKGKDGEWHYANYSDLSLIGPASLGGKIVLELCRRLANEVYLDDTAAEYNRKFLTDIPQAKTPENDNSEKECFYHGQDREPHYADVEPTGRRSGDLHGPDACGETAPPSGLPAQGNHR